MTNPNQVKLRGRPPKSVLEYLEVDTGHTTPCWLWQRGLSEGYGSVRVGNRTTYAHRVYYERHVGPIPEGLDLDHKCRNRHCVNPEHLEPVTRAENIRRGALTKLSVVDVLTIRARYAAGDRPCDISKDYPQVSSCTISNVVARRSWRDV